MKQITTLLRNVGQNRVTRPHMAAARRPQRYSNESSKSGISSEVEVSISVDENCGLFSFDSMTNICRYSKIY
jgi:outer membrane biosynthesis protein TonB